MVDYPILKGMPWMDVLYIREYTPSSLTTTMIKVYSPLPHDRPLHKQYHSHD